MQAQILYVYISKKIILQGIYVIVSNRNLESPCLLCYQPASLCSLDLLNKGQFPWPRHQKDW